MATGLGALLLVGGAVLTWGALRPAAAAAPRPAPIDPAVDAGAPAMALVFVSGAVAHPGLYRLSPGARVSDAIAAAAGITADADPSRLPNLASRIHDGHQVNVPYRRTGSGTAAYKLDVNSATLDELRAVPGMPLGLPEAIVDYRTQFGAFRSLSDMRVQLGLDGPTVTGLRPYLRVVPPSP